MKLFDDVERTDTKRKRYSDPEYAYLNRSGRPEAIAIRKLLEEWYATYPDTEKPDLKGRLTSKKDESHLGALLELYLFKLLTKLGFNVDLHPRIAGTEKTPDFLVSKGDRRLYYLEATSVAGSPATRAALLRMYRVLDRLDEIHSPDFDVHARFKGLPSTDPPASKIANFLEKQIAGLDPKEPSEVIDLEGYELGDWKVGFSVWPKGERRRGNPEDNAVKGIMWPLQDVTAVRNLAKSIKDKGNRYGELDLPYLIALNTLYDFHVHDDEIEDALFGHKTVNIRTSKDGKESGEPGRAGDGALLDKTHPVYTRVSGVLVYSRLSAWTLAKVSPVLWHNPWCGWQRSFHPGLLPVRQKLPYIHWVEQEGKPVSEVLGLDSDWPESE